MFSWRRSLHLSVAATALGVSVLTGALVPGKASAGLLACRSDPYVVLSNGAQVDLSASINDSASDIKQTLYVLHTPVGTRPVLTVKTDGLLGLTEKFVFYADEPANTYDTYTTVTTGAKNVSVTASTVVLGIGVLGIPSASGYSGQSLHTHIYWLL